MSGAEKLRINYNNPEIFNEPVKRTRDDENEVVKIGYGLRKCKLN